jgi:hypothetical protein
MQKPGSLIRSGRISVSAEQKNQENIESKGVQ